MTAEIEPFTSKVNSGVIDDDDQYFLVDCYLDEEGTLCLCWLDYIDLSFMWEYFSIWDGSVVTPQAAALPMFPPNFWDLLFSPEGSIDLDRTRYYWRVDD